MRAIDYGCDGMGLYKPEVMYWVMLPVLTNESKRNAYIRWRFVK